MVSHLPSGAFDPIFRGPEDPELRVEKRTHTVCIGLSDASTLQGELFLDGGHAHRTGADRVIALLNDPRSFLPFKDEASGRMLVLARDRIATVELMDSGMGIGFELDPDPTQSLREVTFVVGSPPRELRGVIYTGNLPPERRRVTDLLNVEELFVALVVGSRTTLINKHQIQMVVVG